MRALVALLLAVLAGCDSGGAISRLRGDESSARDLFARVAQADPGAKEKLRQRAQGRDVFAAFYAGLAEEKYGNVVEAAKMYGVAASALPAAKHNMALLILKGVRRPSDTVDTALQLLEQAANKDVLESMMLLAAIYENGWPGVKVNPPLAVQWYQRANEFANDPRAQYRLGIACLDGFGRSRDEDEAFRLLTSSAKRGLVEAQRELGIRMLDPVQSAQWLTVAAINDSRYQREAAQAQSKLTIDARLRVQQNAQLWAHAHHEDLALANFAEPIRDSSP